MNDIIFISMVVLGGIALVSAVILFFAAKKFAVSEDARILEIDNILPQANCGGCGKAGCHDFANACLNSSEEEFARLLCPVGGQPVMNKIAAVLGYSVVEREPTVSVLRCNGTCENAPAKVAYDGVSGCRIADRISCGLSGCPNGCLRLGDCVKACPFDALHIDEITGIPVVDEDKCTSCGVCVKICPRQLFEIRPKGKNGQRVYVACKNTQKGAQARKNCKVACIACGKCAKICPEISIENNLSYIPASVDVAAHGEELAKACPTGAIILTPENKNV